MVLVALIAVLIQMATVGVLLWVVRSFGAFSRSASASNTVMYYEMINMREEVRRLREVNELLSNMRSA